MQTILFPTDFSNNAIHASLYAGMLAKQLDAKVILLHAYPVPIPTITEQQLIFDTEISVLQSEEDSKNNLAIFTDKFIEDTGLLAENTVQIIEYGIVHDIIINTAKLENVDFIVMATKGTSNAVDRWLDNNAQSVIDSVECPVWLIPEHTPITLPQVIMYAADFEDDEITSTHKVLDITQSLGAFCKVIHIHEYFELNIAGAVQAQVNELEKEFENDDVTFKNLNRIGIVEGLETYMQTHRTDVLALAIYEKSFLSKIFNTSISKHFVEEATLPILTFKK